MDLNFSMATTSTVSEDDHHPGAWFSGITGPCHEGKSPYRRTRRPRPGSDSRRAHFFYFSTAFPAVSAPPGAWRDRQLQALLFATKQIQAINRRPGKLWPPNDGARDRRVTSRHHYPQTHPCTLTTGYMTARNARQCKFRAEPRPLGVAAAMWTRARAPPPTLPGDGLAGQAPTARIDQGCRW